MDPLFEIELERPDPGSRDAGQSLYQQLKDAIRDGRLAAGTALPASRKSAAFFGLSRNTVADVYDRLGREGWVVARHGSGTCVADRVSKPDASTTRTSPYRLYRRLSASQLRGLENKPPASKSPQSNQGSFHLHDAITGHSAMTRAVVCGPQDVVVTAGAQQAFDLLARVLVTAGKTVVAIEDPGYPMMRVAFAAAGARLVPVAVDAEGLRVDQLPVDVRIICVCPSHQFPLGITLSKRRRAELVSFARRNGAVIIEDDYDGEFRFGGKPLQSLRAADAADVVLYVGTFSKCMLPSLRLGFIVVPEWARRSLVAAKNCLDWHCSVPLPNGGVGFYDRRSTGAPRS
jgi:GntR family transcriptional regulator/MocR family aminotransferase